jgi:C-terminal binding protein
MAEYRVVITDFIHDELEPERAILNGVATLEALDSQHEDQLEGRIEDADAIMLYHSIQLSARTIDRLTQCRLIVRCGVGVDNVDCNMARRKGIPVANIPDYGTEEVSDSAVGMILSLSRGITRLNSQHRDAGRDAWSYTTTKPLYRLREKVCAVIGLGRIGTAVALRAKSFGMDVVFFDPFLPNGIEKALGIRRVESLDDLLSQAFILTLHCPLTGSTEGLINAVSLSQMPWGSYLVNTARGGIVNSADVVAAIESGRLAGAAIDVLPYEPPGVDEPLVSAWRDRTHPAHHRVIINPHASFYSEESLTEMRCKGAENCRRALLSQPLNNIVN